MTSFLLICGREWSETLRTVQRVGDYAPGFGQTWRGAGTARESVVTQTVLAAVVVVGGEVGDGDERCGREREGERKSEQWALNDYISRQGGARRRRPLRHRVASLLARASRSLSPHPGSVCPALRGSLMDELDGRLKPSNADFDVSALAARRRGQRRAHGEHTSVGVAAAAAVPPLGLCTLRLSSRLTTPSFSTILAALSIVPCPGYLLRRTTVYYCTSTQFSPTCNNQFTLDAMCHVYHYRAGSIAQW